MLVLEAPQAGGHQSAPPKITDSLMSVLAIDNRQAADIIVQHLYRSFRNQLIGIGHD